MASCTHALSHCCSQQDGRRGQTIWVHWLHAASIASPVAQVLWVQLHEPQSPGQLLHVSPAEGWQLPSPQLAPHTPQSAGQLTHVSPPVVWQLPSPQRGWLPQTSGHSWAARSTHDASQAPEQHEGRCWVQIVAEHEVQVSASAVPVVHSLCPHDEQVPQSAGQLSQLSLPWQTPLPHTAVVVLPLAPPVPAEPPEEPAAPLHPVGSRHSPSSAIE